MIPLKIAYSLFLSYAGVNHSEETGLVKTLRVSESFETFCILVLLTSSSWQLLFYLRMIRLQVCQGWTLENRSNLNLFVNSYFVPFQRTISGDPVRIRNMPPCTTYRRKFLKWVQYALFFNPKQEYIAHPGPLIS